MSNKPLIKERDNMIYELWIGVYKLTKIINNETRPKGDIKGITTRGGRTTSVVDPSQDCEKVEMENPLKETNKEVTKPSDDQTKEKPAETEQPIVNKEPTIKLQSDIPFPTRLRKGKEDAQLWKFMKISQLPLKEKDPGRFSIPCHVGDLLIDNALADLGANISLIPYTMYEKLGLDMPKDFRIPIILGRPFLATAHAMIDVFNKKITLSVGEDRVIFDMYDAMKRPSSKEDNCYSIDEIDEAMACVKESIRRIDYCNTAYPMEQKNEFKKEQVFKASANEIGEKKPELKKLPSHPEYAYLNNDESLPFIISSKLSAREKKNHFCRTDISYFRQLVGFFQIPIAPEDQEKTNFTCPYGNFAYKRMPFGLCNAPAIFQRCMTAIFHDMVEDFMEVFMDNFSVFGSSFENCLENLDKMLASMERRKRFFSQAKYYFWHEPHAFIQCPDNLVRRCIDGKEKFKIIEHCHSGPTGGHHSASVTRRKVYDVGFYWPNIFKDAKDFIAQCDACQRSKNISSRNEMPQNNIQVCEVFDVSGLDFMGPYPDSRGNKYTLVAVDYISKWVEAQVFPTNDARVVVKFLRSLFARFGVPRAFTLLLYPGKLKAKWYGPFIIKSAYQYGTIEITDENGISFKVNRHRLKKYRGGGFDEEKECADDVVNFRTWLGISLRDLSDEYYGFRWSNFSNCKEDTAYLCLNFTKYHEELKSYTAYRFYEEVTPRSKNDMPPRNKRTINHLSGGKLRDKNANEPWALLEELALYDNESCNNPRDFAKLVKATSLPQDVLRLVSNFMASQDARLSKLEADFKRQQGTRTPKTKETNQDLEDEFKDLHLNSPVVEVSTHAPIYNTMLDKYIESLELGNGYSLKDKNEAKTDKTKPENETSVKNRSRRHVHLK
ncbi:reverse transcriptase domain-containing protein [Tanacetum coccineum]